MLKLPNFRPRRSANGPSRFSIGKVWHRTRKQVVAGVLATTSFLVFGVPPAAAFRAPRRLDDGRTVKLPPAPAAKPRPEARRLSAKEMQELRGGGPYRVPQFSGTLPWQKSFRDINLCNGNLFKSFTDIQVAPARGAGLAWQRSYNSNEDRVGPFGVGWTHAYDIRIEEAGNNLVPRVDFFGGSHNYTRDADGLYTPPPYMFDELDSNYDLFLVNGPPAVLEDLQRGKDGSLKHFFANGDERACDWMEDRHGNRTTLTYGLTVTIGAITKKLLTRVTDPSGRYLDITWGDVDLTSGVAWRIKKVEGPIDPITTTAVYTVEYGYNANYQLETVTHDPGGVGHLNRTTTYGYATVNGETNLLNTITDPLNQTVTYGYGLKTLTVGEGLGAGSLTWLWATSVAEPIGISTNLTWTINTGAGYGAGSPANYSANPTATSGGVTYVGPYIHTDGRFRCVNITVNGVTPGGAIPNQPYSYNYDDDNNVIVETGLLYWKAVNDPNSPSPTVSQSPEMRIESTYGPHGNVLTQTYEGFASSTVTTSYYDASKYFQKASVTDAEGNTTYLDYFDSSDPSVGKRGEVKWVRDARYPVTGEQYEYTYNSYGQKLTETNLRNVVTQFTYGDTWGNMTQAVQDPGAGHLNRTTTMTYDVVGRITASTDPKSQSSSYTYSNVGQTLIASLPGETVTYTYGANGRTEQIADNRGTTQINYLNGTNRISSVQDPVNGTISYTYRPAGERATLTLPGSGTWTYTYSTGTLLPKPEPDSASVKLDKITDDTGSRAVHYAQDARGRLFQTRQQWHLSKWLVTTYGYEDVGSQHYGRGLLKQLKNQLYLPGMGGSIVTTLHQNDYTYDDNRNRLTNGISDNVGLIRTESYGYDALNRLTSVNYGDGTTQSYTFDAQGNRLTRVENGVSQSYAYDLANRLTNRAGGTYTNDLNGNTLTGGGRTNTWDGRNRLTQSVYSGVTTSHTYSNDGLRRRTVNATTGTTTDFVLDGSNVVRTNLNGNVDKTYLHGIRGPEYERDSAGTVLWNLFDALGSVVGTVNETGALVSARKFDVYGLVRGSTGPSGTKHKFVGSLGHPSEDETGLIYMRARYYDPVIGRFASEDPAGDGENWYTYAYSNPIRWRDITGKTSYEDIEEGSAGSQILESGGGPPDVLKWMRGHGEQRIFERLERILRRPVDEYEWYEIQKLWDSTKALWNEGNCSWNCKVLYHNVALMLCANGEGELITLFLL